MASLDDDKLRVLEASDIASVIGEYVRLVPKGREFACLCPFHDDHNPSMYVVPHKRMFHCFVCGAGGDVFTFIQRYHGVGFPEALKMLAERAGIELTARSPRDRPEGPSRSSLIEANRTAHAFFRAILRDHPGGEAARALVERRGITPEMVERFGLGAAPDRWDGLLLAIRRKRLDDDPFVAAGLLRRRDQPEPYDAMRNRLIFPIHGETGEPIAFGGRRVNDEDEPKYINSPESPIFDKSRTLFGLPMARRAIRDAGRAVIVEGYTDVIACHQAGIENVVGTLGTAFTAQHAQKLRGQCNEVVLLFDGDEAGQNAADRAIEVLIAARVDIRVATLAGATDAKDPDELLARPGGAETLAGVLDNAEPVIERWARRVREREARLGPASRGRFLDEQIERLATFGLEQMSPIERDAMLAEIAGALGVPQRLVSDTYARSRAVGRKPADAPRDGGGRAGLRPVDRFRLHLLARLIDARETPDPARVAAALRVDLGGCDPGLVRVVEDAARTVEAGERLEPARLLAAVDDPAVTTMIAGVLAAPSGEGDSAREDLEGCLQRLEAHGLLTSRGPAGAADAMGERLARLRQLHAGHGGNTVANPYRFAGRVSGGRGPYDRPVEEGRIAERSHDGENQADDAGAAPGTD